MDMNQFEQLWNEVSEIGRITSNGYRVFVEYCLSGPMSQKELLEKKKDWKVSSVSNTVRMLHSIGLLDCKVDNGNIIYFVNEDFKAEDYLSQQKTKEE